MENSGSLFIPGRLTIYGTESYVVSFKEPHQTY